MTGGIESLSDVGKMLGQLSSNDQERFEQYKDAMRKKQINESPLLDQLCWVRLMRSQLSDSYAKALSGYEERLAKRAEMPGRWRKSPTMKSPDEFESPVPWLHPFKLAGEALAPLEEELEKAVASGDTEAKDTARLGEILDTHGIRFPISSNEPISRFPPRPLRIHK